MSAARSEIDVWIGRRLYTLRELRRYTPKQLAHDLGISAAQVYRYERGQDRLSAARLVEIAFALDFPISAFFDGITPGKETAHAA